MVVLFQYNKLGEKRFMKERFSSLLSSAKRNIGKLAVACFGVVAMVGTAFADGTTPTPPAAPSTNDFQQLMSNITSVFTTSTILEIMGAILLFGMAYALLYWGARKAVRAGFSAVKKGKIRV